MKRALFLDFDGTLVDSIPQLRNAYSDFLHQFGVEGSPQEFDELNGPQLYEIINLLRDRYQLAASQADLMNLYREILVSREKDLRPREGAEDLLNAATLQGFRIAIVTSSSQSRVDDFLERNGLATVIERVIGAEMCSRSKPHPEPYLIALQAMSANPQRSISVEDSHAGVESAASAGLPVVAIGQDNMPPSMPVLASVHSLHEVIPFLTEGP